MEMQPRDTDVVLGGIDRPIEGAMVLGGFGAPKISELAREGINAPFGKWAALKVPKGSDFFSKLSLRQLEKLVPYYNPHSARNGRQKTIKKQAQGEDSSVGKREGRNLGYEDEEEINWKYV